jgi:hypothetical protein
MEIRDLTLGNAASRDAYPLPIVMLNLVMDR